MQLEFTPLCSGVVLAFRHAKYFYLIIHKINLFIIGFAAQFPKIKSPKSQRSTNGCDVLFRKNYKLSCGKFCQAHYDVCRYFVQF